MLRVTGVELLITRTDLEEALSGYASGRSEIEGVELLDGAVVIRLKAAGDRLPMTVPVELRLAPRHASGTTVELDVAWSNLPLLPGFLKELALQRAFEALPGKYRDGVFVVDLAEVLDTVPVQFRIQNVQVAPEGIRVALADVVAFPLEPMALILEPEPGALVPVPSTEEARIPEHQTYYQKLRERVRRFAVEKAPRWAQPLVPWVLAVPDFFVLLVRLARDPRVPTAAKVIVGAVIAYFISPIDLIPDPLPIVGEVDDMAVALFALENVAKRIDPAVIQELWPGEGKVMALVEEGTRLFGQVLPTKMLDAIRRIITRK